MKLYAALAAGMFGMVVGSAAAVAQLQTLERHPHASRYLERPPPLIAGFLPGLPVAGDD